jgi:DNA-directed RNA polymerase subunit F
MPEERLVALAEIKEMLEQESKDRTELTNEQKVALDHASKFAKLSVKDAHKLLADLKELDFITEPVAHRIVDICPQYPEDVRALFAKERLILDKKQIDQVIAAVKKHV